MGGHWQALLPDGWARLLLYIFSVLSLPLADRCKAAGVHDSFTPSAMRRCPCRSTVECSGPGVLQALQECLQPQQDTVTDNEPGTAAIVSFTCGSFICVAA